MKTLTIIRHAKAAAPEQYATDFDRPITARGRKDAKHIGKLLAYLEPPFDWIISSPPHAHARQRGILSTNRSILMP